MACVFRDMVSGVYLYTAWRKQKRKACLGQKYVYRMASDRRMARGGMELFFMGCFFISCAYAGKTALAAVFGKEQDFFKDIYGGADPYKLDAFCNHGYQGTVCLFGKDVWRRDGCVIRECAAYGIDHGF